VIFAKSKDGSLAGVVRVGAEQQNISVPIGPTATCVMRLLHKDKRPYSSQRIVDLHIRVPADPTEERGGGYWVADSEVHPDRDGRLILPNLAVGESYDLCLKSIDSGGGYSPLTTVRLQTPGKQALPDIVYDEPPPWHPPTLDQRIAREFDTKTPIPRQIRDAENGARVTDSSVLITYADLKSPLTKKLFGLYLDDDDIPGLIFREYFTVAVSAAGAKNASVAASEMPVVVAEDAGGNVLGRITRSGLADSNGNIKSDVLLAFLKQHVVPRRDGRTLMADALAQAKQQNKRLIAVQSGPFGDGCVMFDRFLDKTRSLWEKDYLWVNMDARWPHADEVMQSLRGKDDVGLLWYAIVDAQGKVLATSTLRQKGKRRTSIGFPTEPNEIDHFVEMFKSTAKHMTADDFVQLKRALEQANR
jgi:hypothetical protein